jgi:hypothetical protein
MHSRHSPPAAPPAAPAATGDAPEDTLWTYAQLAARTHIPVSTWRWRVAQGLVPHVRLGPRTVRFAPRAIMAYLAAHARGGDAPVGGADGAGGVR